MKSNRKKHRIELERSDIFRTSTVYREICETLLDEGRLIITRTENKERDTVEYFWTLNDRLKEK